LKSGMDDLSQTLESRIPTSSMFGSARQLSIKTEQGLVSASGTVESRSPREGCRSGRFLLRPIPLTRRIVFQVRSIVDHDSAVLEVLALIEHVGTDHDFDPFPGDASSCDPHRGYWARIWGRSEVYSRCPSRRRRSARRIQHASRPAVTCGGGSGSVPLSLAEYTPSILHSPAQFLRRASLPVARQGIGPLVRSQGSGHLPRRLSVAFVDRTGQIDPGQGGDQVTGLATSSFLARLPELNSSSSSREQEPNGLL